MQIRTRLTVQFIFITAGIFIVALLFIYTRFRQYSEDEYNTLLESKARMTATLVLSHENELVVLPDPGSRLVILPYTENITIYDTANRRVFATNPSGAVLPATVLFDIRRDRKRFFQNEAYQAFGALVQGTSGAEFVVVSEGIFDQSKLQQLGTILLFSLIIVVAAVAGGGYFFAGQALRPVARIVQEVESILPTDLSRRLQPVNLHDELAQLVRTFNQMLDRIERAFRMQRSFISNVSHEIKTPLVAMDAQIQFVRQRDRSADDYRQVLDSLHDDVSFISGTADRLLQLARIYSEPSSITFEPIRLDELLLQAREMLLKSHPEYTVLLDLHGMPEEEELMEVRGNESLLLTALLNLFDNGCKFSADHQVRVLARFDEKGRHEVEIQDAGPGIPAAELQRIFEPFYRSPRHTAVKGSGVGLSLVQNILQLHGVSVEVVSEEETGTTFRLRF